MIVPSMSPLEIVNEAKLDLRPLVHKIKPIADRQERAHRKERDRRCALAQLVKWRSPRGNNWFIVLSTSKKSTTVSQLVWWRGTDDRLRALLLDIVGNGTPVLITAHVLDRYLQRFAADRDPIERLGNFFLANHDYSMETIADRGHGQYEVRCGMLQGIARGTWDTGRGIVELATFLGGGDLGKKDEAYSEMLDLKRYFERLTPGQKLEAVRGMEAEIGRQAANGRLDPRDGQAMAMVYRWTGIPPRPRPGLGAKAA